jgi:hypothetical protein
MSWRWSGWTWLRLVLHLPLVHLSWLGRTVRFWDAHFHGDVSGTTAQKDVWRTHLQWSSLPYLMTPRPAGLAKVGSYGYPDHILGVLTLDLRDSGKEIVTVEVIASVTSLLGRDSCWRARFLRSAQSALWFLRFGCWCASHGSLVTQIPLRIEWIEL